MNFKKKDKKEKNEKEQKVRKNPLQMFFELGDKATGGDPVRKAQFDYFFMWILFLAFLLLSSRNWYYFFRLNYDTSYLPWALMGMAISWFQYYALKGYYHIKNNMIKLHSGKMEESKEIEEDSVEDMLDEFKEKGGRKR